MMRVSASVNTKRLKKRLASWTLRLNQEEVEAVRDYGNIFVGQAFKFTPPGGSGVHGTEAKNRQENRIRWDILGDDYGKPIFYRKGGVLRGFTPRKGYKVSPFVVVSKADARQGIQIVNPRLHLRQFGMRRKSNGKYLDWHGPRAFVLRSALMAEYRRRLKNVGRLAAGWVPAARFVGRKQIPSWIARNARGEGHARIIRQEGRGSSITMVNSAHYNAKQTQRLMDGVLETVVAAAIRHRAKARAAKLVKTLNAA